MGKFICFEGVAGAGKTTQVAKIQSIISANRKTVFVTKAFEGDRREATEEFIHKLQPDLPDSGLTFIFQALHAVQASEVSRLLPDYDYIIADRWRETFFSYHRLYGPLSKAPDSVLTTLDEMAFGSLEPDTTFFFDVSPTTAYHRFHAREATKDKILGHKDLLFFEKTVEYYRQVAKAKGWIMIDGEQEEVLVTEQICRTLTLSSSKIQQSNSNPEHKNG